MVVRDEHDAWKAGSLHGVWATSYPFLFDADDVRLADSRHMHGRHFWEWLGAIIVHQDTGYHCLLAKYEFKNHSRKLDAVERILPADVLAICRDRATYGRAQAPDLLMFAPNYSNWFFCEVKGPTDRIRAEQRSKFAALAAASGKPIEVLRFHRSGTHVTAERVPLDLR
jgi:hypothetical protein